VWTAGDGGAIRWLEYAYAGVRAALNDAIPQNRPSKFAPGDSFEMFAGAHTRAAGGGAQVLARGRM
jgi:hypothetical protein